MQLGRWVWVFKLSSPQEIMIGTLMIRIGFGGPIYYNYDKEPPK